MTDGHGDALGVIELRGMRFLVHVGVPDDERGRAQPVEIDLDLHLDLSAAMVSDDVTDTADYGRIADAVAQLAGQVSVALLERLARLVGEVCLATDDRIGAVDVTVRKLHVPVAVDVASAAVRVRVDRP